MPGSGRIQEGWGFAMNRMSRLLLPVGMVALGLLVDPLPDRVNAQSISEIPPPRMPGPLYSSGQTQQRPSSQFGGISEIPPPRVEGSEGTDTENTGSATVGGSGTGSDTSGGDGIGPIGDTGSTSSTTDIGTTTPDFPTTPPTGTPGTTDPGLGDLATSAFGAGLGGNEGGTGISVPGLIGDMGPTFYRAPSAAQVLAPVDGVPQPPPPPGPGARALPAAVRTIKFAENQSPIPRDRFFYNFNYYSEVGQSINEALGIPFRDIEVYRHIFGIEKTYLQGRGSFGLRFPIDTISANIAPGVAQSSSNLADTTTAVGNLQVFLKHILAQDPSWGLLSVGVQVSTPTGPDEFGGARFVDPLNPTLIQPFLGYYFSRDRFFMQGFTSLETPTSDRAPTFLFNDIGFGYRMYQSTFPKRGITSLVPTFEVHVNNPLTHREAFLLSDPAGSADNVNLTYGLNMGVGRRTVLTGGFIHPVTGPRPFDYEIAFLVNIYFGASANRFGGPSTPGLGGPLVTPPVIGE